MKYRPISLYEPDLIRYDEKTSETDDLSADLKFDNTIHRMDFQGVGMIMSGLKKLKSPMGKYSHSFIVSFSNGNFPLIAPILISHGTQLKNPEQLLVGSNVLISGEMIQ